MHRPLFVLALLSLAACGRGGPVGREFPLGLRVEPAPLRLYAGQKLTLQVTALFEYFDWDSWKLRAEDISRHEQLLLWTASGRVAEVGTGPELMALEAGETVLQVYFQGVHASLPLSVSPHPLYRLTVKPEQVALELGRYEQLRVTGWLTDESTVELTSPLYGTVYESSDPLVATATIEGLVFALGDGRAAITARCRDFQAGAQVISGTGRSLYAIDLLPARLELDEGESARLQLVGRYTDQTVGDLTGHPLTIFEIGNPTMVRIDAGGLVTALAPGETIIRAYHRRLQSTTTIIVRRSEQLVDLEVSPAWLSLSAGDRVQLAVRATYLGGEPQEVTGRSQFVALDPDVAATTPGGLVTAMGQGTTPIRAFFGGRAAVCQVSVEQSAEWLEAHPAASRLEPGEQVFLQVIRHGDFGAPQEVTSEAVYRSLAENVAVVEATGRVTAKAPGLASLLISWRGLEAAAQITVAE